jgi:spore coat-associated protein N
MTRMQVLAASPRRILGALATVLAAVGLTVGSSASFSSSAANPVNTFASGSLQIKNAKEGAAVLSASNLKPGAAAQTGTVVIENTGSLGGDFSLTQTIKSDTTPALSPYLNLTVTDCGAGAAAACGDADDSTVFAGALPSLTTKALGAYAAGDKHLYRFAVSLDGGAPNGVQGKSTTVDFDWNAAQN